FAFFVNAQKQLCSRQRIGDCVVTSVVVDIEQLHPVVQRSVIQGLFTQQGRGQVSQIYPLPFFQIGLQPRFQAFFEHRLVKVNMERQQGSGANVFKKLHKGLGRIDAAALFATGNAVNENIAFAADLLLPQDNIEGILQTDASSLDSH